MRYSEQCYFLPCVYITVIFKSLNSCYAASIVSHQTFRSGTSLVTEASTETNGSGTGSLSKDVFM